MSENSIGRAAPTVTTNGATARVLGSGSAGNAIAISADDRTILLDCGFSARETIRRLEECGIRASSVEAILVSHEHSDHIRGVRVLAKRLGVAVWASRGTGRAAAPDALGADVSELRAGEPATIAGMTVVPFSTAHDAAEPLGFRFESSGGASIGILSDSGELTEDAARTLSGCARIGIECNHDVEMLMNGPYPAFLKRRICSAYGHLSNEDAARALESLVSDELTHVVALHLSTTNNTARLARGALRRALDRLAHGALVTDATQNGTCTL